MLCSTLSGEEKRPQFVTVRPTLPPCFSTPPPKRNRENVYARGAYTAPMRFPGRSPESVIRSNFLYIYAHQLKLSLPSLYCKVSTPTLHLHLLATGSFCHLQMSLKTQHPFVLPQKRPLPSFLLLQFQRPSLSLPLLLLSLYHPTPTSNPIAQSVTSIPLNHFA